MRLSKMYRSHGKEDSEVAHLVSQPQERNPMRLKTNGSFFSIIGETEANRLSEGTLFGR